MNSTSKATTATRHVWRPDPGGKGLLLEEPEAQTVIRVARHTDSLDEFREQFRNRERDLLDVATAIFGSDRLAPRRHGKGLGWRREIHVTVPVRDPSFWRQGHIATSLRRAVAELTDDEWHFVYVPRKGLRDQPRQTRLPIFRGSEPVALFSGGLDSLAGTILHREQTGRLPWIVSVASNTHVIAQQRDLVSQLRTHFGENPETVRLRVYNEGPEPRAQAARQRARSFLYFVVAALLARRTESTSVLVLENGITSLNLPISPLLTSTRVTRTTFPTVLFLVEDLIRLALDWPAFRLEAPFSSSTKAEMVIPIAAACRELIKSTVSCARVREGKWCGTCTACLLRRQVLWRSGLFDLDREEVVKKYKTDIFSSFGSAELSAHKRWYFLATMEHVARMLSDEDTISMAPAAVTVAGARALRFGTDPMQELSLIVAAHKRYSHEWLVVLDQARATYPALRPVWEALSSSRKETA